MKRPGPLLKMTFALVALCGALIMLADLLFGVVPDKAAQTRDLRRNVAEALAVQVATLLEADDRRSLQRTLDHVAARSESVLSFGIRRADGVLVVQAGDHPSVWRGVETGPSRLDEVKVPLNAGGQRWGTFEIAFKPRSGHALVHWLTEPLVVVLLFLATFGTLVFGLYLRRALQHLDPASVIPERVQGAFDAMAEGIVVLDARGRMLLANQAFRKLHAQAETEPLRLGHSLSRLSWLAAALPADLAAHPWNRAMAMRAANAGQTIELTDREALARRLVVNSAPITDSGGSIRGCLATFSDVSELHRTNEALVVALAELSATKDEVQAKNGELQRLATRDPLTGCLNRRSFNEALDTLFQLARSRAMSLGCVMLDIDHFKKVNDNFGHAVGDRVIQEVAKKLHESVRSVDLVGRYGGEEFCVVVPGLDLPKAMAFAERLRAKVEQECAAALRDVPGLQVRISLGVDVLTDEMATPAALIDRADQGLYRAKRSGRNQVCAFSPEAAPPTAPQPSAEYDALTGCLNQRGLDAAFERALQEQQACQGKLGSVVFSVDTLKPLVDANGRDVGHQVLQQMALRALLLTPSQGALARVGPQEFALLAPGLGSRELSGLAERLRVELPQAALAGVPGEPLPALTLSVGVDSLAALSPAVPTLFDRADRARLRAARTGGNRVCLFVPEMAGSGTTAVAGPAS